MKNCIFSLVLLEDYYVSSGGAPWVDWNCWLAISSMQEAGIGLMPCSLVINDNGQTFVINLLGVAVITVLITLVQRDPPQWVQIEHFWREFSSVDHCSGGKSFYSDEEENQRLIC
ncbi:hypothetical protein ACE6H2_026269 [Prunus campanulata]